MTRINRLFYIFLLENFGTLRCEHFKFRNRRYREAEGTEVLY